MKLETGFIVFVVILSEIVLGDYTCRRPLRNVYLNNNAVVWN